MQLLLLEQQARRRQSEVVARAAHNINGFPHLPSNMPMKHPDYAISPWQPTNVSLNNIQRMRSLEVNIIAVVTIQNGQLAPNGSTYQLCDYLHRLAGLIAKISPQNIKRFDVSLSLYPFTEHPMQQDETTKLVRMLLQPLRRLRGIKPAQITHVEVADLSPFPVQQPRLPIVTCYDYNAPHACSLDLQTSVAEWQLDVSSPEPAPNDETFNASMIIANLITQLSSRSGLHQSERCQLNDIGRRARIAREHADFAKLRELFINVRILLGNHRKAEEEFMAYSIQLIESVNSVFLSAV
jgi:hypothetical protein